MDPMSNVQGSTHAANPMILVGLLWFVSNIVTNHSKRAFAVVYGND